MFIQNENFPTHINGEEIIKIVRGNKYLGDPSRRATFQGMIDRNEMLFSEDSRRYHLGLISSWGMQGKESYPMISQLLERGSEIKVNGYHGEFTYDKLFYTPSVGLRTVASTRDSNGDFPGSGESVFSLILSEKVYDKEILTSDLYGDEAQIIVVGDSVPSPTGEGWYTEATVTEDSEVAYINPSLLEAGVPYNRINNVGVEYSTAFPGVEMPTGAPAGKLTARFRLGGIRGIEGYVTGFADILKSGDVTKVTASDKEAQEGMQMLKNIYADGDSAANTVVFGTKGDPTTTRATSLMEFLVEKTLMKRTATAHMWQKQGKYRASNGAISYLNEGLWHQIRRGKIITVPRVMGITKAHIVEAVNYVFRNNPNLPWEQREIVFEGGKLAEQNLLMLFQNEIQQQMQVMQQNGMFKLLFGDDGLLSDKLKHSLVTGNSLDNLELSQLIKFTSVILIGIGKVRIKHNPALDRMSGQHGNYRSQLPGGYDWTSHSLIIWDVRDSKYSNNTKDISIKDMGEEKVKDNLYLVRPEEGMTVKGQENGRWDRGKTSGIISSSRMIGQGFWAFNSSACWVPRPEDIVIIELSKGARNSGYTQTMY